MKIEMEGHLKWKSILFGFILLGVLMFWIKFGINTGIQQVDLSLDIMFTVFTGGMWFIAFIEDKPKKDVLPNNPKLEENHNGILS